MANLSIEEPYAVMPARTGLWEPRDGNDPGPPGPERFRLLSNCPEIRWEFDTAVAADGHCAEQRTA